MSSNNLKIIVVDDEDIYHRLLKLMFKKYKLDVFFCNNYDNLRELAEEFPENILIIDYSLGEETGADYIRKLNSEMDAKQNFIAISASVEKRVEDEMIELGARRFFQKDDDLIENLPNTILDFGKELGYTTEKE